MTYLTTQVLSAAVLGFYLIMATQGWLIAFAALGSPRYFPVLSLMGMGGGVPALGLGVIRGARLAGYVSDPNDRSQVIILLVCFGFTVICWGQALNLILLDRVKRRYAKRNHLALGA